jgi:hypothetical protein
MLPGFITGLWGGAEANTDPNWYVLVYKTEDQPGTATLDVQDFDGEEVDGADAHDPGSPSLITIPALWDGHYGRVAVNYVSPDVTASAGLAADTQKDSASYLGHIDTVTRTQSTFPQTVGGYGAILPLATGDVYRARVQHEVGSFVSASDRSWMQLETFADGFQGALAHKSANQTLSDSVWGIMAFGSELYDTDGFHSTVTANSRMVIPADVSLIRVSANLVSNDGANQFILNITKNGFSVSGSPVNEVSTSQFTDLRLGAISAPLAVVEGDYFEVFAYHSGNTRVVLDDDGTWFQIEVLPDDLKYALVKKSASQSIPANVPTILAWDAETVDVGGWHSTVTLNSRLVVPEGVSFVRLFGNITVGTTGAFIEGYFLKNGSSFVGNGSRVVHSTGADSTNFASSIIEVEPGDYFEMVALFTNTLSVGSSVVNWFSAEEVRDPEIT